MGGNHQVNEKVLVDLLQVKNVLKTILHSFQMREQTPKQVKWIWTWKGRSSNVRTHSSHM